MHRRRISGRVMQLIVGVARLARGALSLLDSVHKLAAKHWMSCAINSRGLFECGHGAYAGLLPLLKGD